MVRLNYTPHAGQKSVHECPARFRVVAAGRRFGKTTLAAAELLRQAGAGRRCVWFLAPTYRQAKGIIWRMLLNLTPVECMTRVSHSELEIDLTNGSRIEVKGADREDSLRGMKVHFVAMDEFAGMKPTVWPEIVRPALTDTRGGALFTGTPSGRDHFHALYRLGRSGADPNYASFRFSTSDNPHVGGGELDAARRELPDRVYRREYEAEFGRAEGLVYPEFRERTHAVGAFEVPDHWPRWRAIDPGLRNPTACLWLACGPSDRMVVYREYLEAGRLASENARAIAALSEGEAYRRTLIDPSAAARSGTDGASELDLYRANGVEAVAADNDVRMGLIRVAEALKPDAETGEPALKIFRGCDKLIEEIEGYRWDAGGGADAPERPVKKNDHLLDCLRYLLADGPGYAPPEEWSWDRAAEAEQAGKANRHTGYF